MLTLSRRLTQLRKQAGQPDQARQEQAVPVMWGSEKNLVDRVRLARANALGKPRQVLDDNSLAQQFGGEVFQPGLILFQSKHPLDALHGHYNATLSNGIQQTEILPNIETLLFVDTETTGLSSATGTMVFLLGAAEIKDNYLLLEQMLLTQPGAEKQLLEWFSIKCEDKSHLVSYNGKSFDIPLLNTRYQMSRMKNDLSDKAHIDLLHWVRRCHRRQMADCRLPSAEKFCLEFSRIDDMPGSEAPMVWQEMLRFANTSRLKPLLQHHAWDIVSLVGLLHYVEKQLSNPQLIELDYVSMANYYLQSNQCNKAQAILQNNISKLDDNARFMLAKLLRKDGQWGAAVMLWQQLHATGYLAATESLAKYYEHKLKEYATALSLTQLLMTLENKSEHNNRLVRLRRKLDRVNHEI